MTDIDVREIFGTIGEIIFDIEPELTEMIEEGDISKDITDLLIKLEKDAQSLKEYVEKDFYKDEMHKT